MRMCKTFFFFLGGGGGERRTDIVLADFDGILDDGNLSKHLTTHLTIYIGAFN